MATTRDKLIAAAAALLDGGGQEAVTLRAIAEQVGVSHNAPYRHFRNRSMLLAAVAERDFADLRAAFELAAASNASAALHKATHALIDYGLTHPARYRLLFSDPGLLPEESLKEAAFASFEAFRRIVARCQHERELPGCETVALTGLIYATTHGAIDLHLGGRASDAKGLGALEETAELLFTLLKPMPKAKVSRKPHRQTVSQAEAPLPKSARRLT